MFGESILDRPQSEQMFHAVTWATNTRRLDFSNGAQEIIRMEKFRRDTGLNPEARGGREAFERYRAREAGVPGGSGGSSVPVRPKAIIAATISPNRPSLPE